MFKLVVLLMVLTAVVITILFVTSSWLFAKIGDSVLNVLNNIKIGIFGEEDKNE